MKLYIFTFCDYNKEEHLDVINKFISENEIKDIKINSFAKEKTTYHTVSVLYCSKDKSSKESKKANSTIHNPNPTQLEEFFKGL